MRQGIARVIEIYWSYNDIFIYIYIYEPKFGHEPGKARCDALIWPKSAWACWASVGKGVRKWLVKETLETQETQERRGKTLRSLRTVNYWWGIRAMLWKGHQALRTFVLCCSLAGCRPRTLSMTAHENGLHLAWVVLHSLNSDTPIGKNCEGMLRPNIAYNGSFNLLSRFFTLAFCSLLPIPCLNATEPSYTPSHPPWLFKSGKPQSFWCICCQGNIGTSQIHSTALTHHSGEIWIGIGILPFKITEIQTIFSWICGGWDIGFVQRAMRTRKHHAERLGATLCLFMRVPGHWYSMRGNSSRACQSMSEYYFDPPFCVWWVETGLQVHASPIQRHRLR